MQIDKIIELYWNWNANKITFIVRKGMAAIDGLQPNMKWWYNLKSHSHVLYFIAMHRLHNTPPFLAPFHVHPNDQPHQQNILTWYPLWMCNHHVHYMTNYFGIMTSAFKFSKSSLHCCKLQRTLAMENICSISIWEHGIARICVAKKPTLGDLRAFSKVLPPASHEL